MNDDKKRTALQVIAEVMGNVADRHEDHGCGVGEVARHVRDQATESLAAMGGPAQVATDGYRANYETIFGKRVEPGQA